MQKIKFLSNVFIALTFVFIFSQCTDKSNSLDLWPEEASPKVIGKKLSELFLQSPHGYYNSPGVKPHIPYFEVCTWYGALTFAEVTGNTDLVKKLEQRFEPLFNEEWELIPAANHVDYNVFGALALEFYLQTQDEKYLELGMPYADKQWDIPGDSTLTERALNYYEQGYSWQTRLWIDDMYMITMIQSQAYRVTGDRKYIDRAAKEMVFYLDTLQQSNGLFYHAPGAPFFWGRGNGWMAAGMTELLHALPTDNPDRPKIMEGYNKMMETLLQYQTEDGAWRQLVDDAESWKESSCTGMFTYAMITGVKNGWLDKADYEEAARKGWLALVSFINKKGEVQEVCEGTGAKNDRQHYYDRQRIAGDFHGQAPVLWCATALIRE
ncbi:MAG: glycoside hydrolase family 88 protein [Cyclobacteriaceae bacterium]|nr:glycoside hydrolase family 88 protein [Cyclobacteriaceae bacterium]